MIQTITTDTAHPALQEPAEHPGARNLRLHWFLPPFADSRHVVGGGHGSGVPTGDREVDLRYLKQLALAAEHNGFHSVLIPVGLWCEDPWLVAASLIDATEKLNFLVAVRPGLSGALRDAQAAATFQRLSGDRLAINVVTGGEDAQQRAAGDQLGKNQRYDRTEETLRFWQTLWTSEAPVNFHGQHVTAAGALLPHRPKKLPPIYFAGSSATAGKVAGRHADTYITWGEAPAAVGEKINWINAEAAVHGRRPDHALRVHVISRDTSEEAWQAAAKLLQHVSADDVRRAQDAFRKSQSESQRRISELHGRGGNFTAGSDPHDLEIHPGLWAGVGLVRGGAGTALVGSHAEVAALIAEYHAQGITELVLSGYPHLEETFHVGEGLVPALKRLGFHLGHQLDVPTN